MTAAAVKQEFDRAIELHRAGKLAEAARLYRRILAADPGHAAAMQMLGVAATQAGQFPQAVALIEEALAKSGAEPAGLVNLGNALLGAGRANDAEAAYGRALALAPAMPEALFGQGNVRAQQAGREEEAIESYRAALAARPGFVEALANMAGLLARTGRDEDSIAAWDTAIAARADAPELRIGKARVLAALERIDEAAAEYRGVAALPGAPGEALYEAANGLAELGRHRDAADLYREAARRRPGLFPALNNLGNMLRELGELAEAEAAYRQALAASPDNPHLLSNLGLVEKDQGRLAEAEADCRRSLTIRPTAVGHSNLGLVLSAAGRMEAALDAFRAAHALDPDSADIAFHEGVALLQLGRFAEGWRKYESRWERLRSQERRRAYAQPQWTGEPAPGRTILLWSEQGFGDTLQFARYAPLVAARGARVMLECQPALARLMACVAGIARVVPRGLPLPEFDLHCPLLSLPLAFGTAIETIPAETPYIRLPAADVAAWAARMPPGKQPRIGLVWAGDSRRHDIECFLTDRRRSLAFDSFAPLLTQPGLRFFSLQIGPGAAQAGAFPELIDLTGDISDFLDTAALVANLDLVISVDTSVAHLAGALGKTVWVLSRFDGCWRWLMDRADSPWYPTLRLYRQPAPETWPAVIESLAADLAAWAKARG